MLVGTGAGIHFMSEFTFKGRELFAWISRHVSVDGDYYRCNVLPTNYYVSIRKHHDPEQWVEKDSGNADEMTATLGRIVEDNESHIKP